MGERQNMKEHEAIDTCQESTESSNAGGKFKRTQSQKIFFFQDESLSSKRLEGYKIEASRHDSETTAHPKNLASKMDAISDSDHLLQLQNFASCVGGWQGVSSNI